MDGSRLTVRIDDRNKVKLESSEQRYGSLIAVQVVVDESERDILGGGSGYPFASIQVCLLSK